MKIFDDPRNIFYLKFSTDFQCSITRKEVSPAQVKPPFKKKNHKIRVYLSKFKFCRWAFQKYFHVSNPKILELARTVILQTNFNLF